MKIHITERYKSLSAFVSDELPSFTIITGLNGSGKTQLFEQFKALWEYNSSKAKVALSTVPSFTRMHISDLESFFSGWGTSESYHSPLKDIHTKYLQEILHHERIKMWSAIDIENISKDDLYKLMNETQTAIGDWFKNKYPTLKDNPLFATGNARDRTDYRAIMKHYHDFFSLYEQCKFVSIYRKKSLMSLTQADFLQANVPYKFVNREDLIESSLDKVFYAFLRKRYINSTEQYRKKTFSEDNNSIPVDEFNRLNKSPWVTVNEIFEKHKLDYYFKEIGEQDFSPDAAIEFEFVKKSIDTKIPFSNLSSGEKVIIGLIFKLFTSNFHNNDISVPDLVFIDEPDAHLHPSLSKLLIEVLDETFVKTLGIQVIITTHSPSTVALASEESLYEMRNIPVTQLRKISKDDALKLLTTGIPNLSIDYKNHRQIFVESPTDLQYYQALYDKIYPFANSVHRLYFVSYGTYGDSNSDKVVNLVKDLRSAGNKAIFGIIDWDNKNDGSNEILVHGKHSRYSIENFILDPLYLSILLIQRRYGELIAHIQYKDTENEYDIVKSPRAQLAIDFIIKKLAPNLIPESRQGTLVDCHYGDSHSFKIPSWLLTTNGKRLREKVLQTFLPLTSISGKFELEEKLTKIIAKVYPTIPRETEELLKLLGKN